VPANRSRTENWRKSLEQICERGGGLEISVPACSPSGDNAPDLVWRVKLQSIGEHSMTIEAPTAAGRPVPLSAGLVLVAAMTIGQNRWMFTTTVSDAPAPGKSGPVELALPEKVERCSRREFFRVSMASVRPPAVTARPLSDLSQAVAAENALRDRFADWTPGQTTSPGPSPAALFTPLPPGAAGPAFTAVMQNLGGGGLGLIVGHEHSSLAERTPYLWLEIDLRPRLPFPLGLVARRVHSHLDAGQHIYLGLCFEFAHNPGHQAFITEMMCSVVDAVRREQLAARAA